MAFTELPYSRLQAAEQEAAHPSIEPVRINCNIALGAKGRQKVGKRRSQITPKKPKTAVRTSRLEMNFAVSPAASVRPDRESAQYPPISINQARAPSRAYTRRWDMVYRGMEPRCTRKMDGGRQKTREKKRIRSFCITFRGLSFGRAVGRKDHVVRRALVRQPLIVVEHVHRQQSHLQRLVPEA